MVEGRALLESHHQGQIPGRIASYPNREARHGLARSATHGRSDGRRGQVARLGQLISPISCLPRWL